jgi:hypothetical protein
MAHKRDIKQIVDIVRRAGLNKEQRRLLHDRISGQGYRYAEILEIAREIRRDYPKKH